MKLVTRKELVLLPKGTVYQEYDPCLLGPLMVLEEVCGPPEDAEDWFESTLGPCINMNTHSFELDSMFSREGSFDSGLRYLVLEPLDIEIIIAKLQGTPDVGTDTQSTPMPAL